MSNPSLEVVELKTALRECLLQAETLKSRVSDLDWPAGGSGISTQKRQADRLELTRLEDLLAFTTTHLRTMRNSYCAVNRLPTELLAHIFKFMHPDSSTSTAFPKHYRPVPYHDSIKLATVLSRVCRYWRDTLKLHPSTWTTLVFWPRKNRKELHDGLTSRFLFKSGAVPITVYTMTFHGIACIGQQLHRLRHLFLSLPTSDWTETVATALASSAPLLEWLECRADHCTDDLSLDRRPHLPLLFSGNTPRLRKLRLHGFESWDHRQFHEVTHVSITGCTWLERGAARGTQEFLDRLRMLNGIEELYLASLYPWTTWWNVDHSQLVWMFTYVHIPVGVSLNISVLRDADRPYSIFSENVARFENLQGLQSMKIVEGHYLTASGPHGSLVLNLSSKSRLNPGAFLSGFPFTPTLQELCIEGSLIGIWYDPFASLVSLRSLHLRPRYMSHLTSGKESNIIRALISTTVANSQPGRVPCGQLSELRVDVDFGLSYTDPGSFLYDVLLMVERRAVHKASPHIVNLLVHFSGHSTNAMRAPPLQIQLVSAQLQVDHETQVSVVFETIIQKCRSHAEELLAGLSELDWMGYGTQCSIRASGLPGLAELTDVVWHAFAIAQTIQNSECHVNRLPMEVLAHVFSFTPAGFESGDEFPAREIYLPQNDSLLAFFQLRHVCRYWKQTLDQNPQVFASIVVDSGSWREDGSESSLLGHRLSLLQSQPFTFYTSKPLSIQAVVSESHRLRGVYVDVPWSLDDRVESYLSVFKDLADPAPQLEWMDLKIRHGGFREKQFVLPLVFAGNLPRLRKLRLSGFLSCDANLFGSLTHLSLSGYALEESVPRRPQHFIDMLRASPMLEELYLQQLDPWWSPWNDISSRPNTEGSIVCLPKLVRVVARYCSISQMTSIFAYLRIIAGVSLSITELTPNQDQTIFDIFSEHPEHFENLNGLTSLRMELGSSGQLSGKGSSGSFAVGLARHAARFRFAPFPFYSTIRELKLVAFDYWGGYEVDWYTVFSAMTALQKLEITSPNTGLETDIIRLLLWTSAISTSPIFCPQLREIAVYQDKQLIYGRSSWLHDLLLCAEHRSRRGHPLSVVRVGPHEQKPLSTKEADLPLRRIILETLGAYVETVEVTQG
ncbi:hypothetical protein EIP91_004415 [Steccherinum ochraceum]|uniref:F-box domain-containing protein n=1 Tax=Steccherinum ochraceum TaxID=92696 RepID=A0A4R0S1X1_9APHY|nr:hypothetical protein EIP91_004415 [Steccherinum ochraceum]